MVVIFLPATAETGVMHERCGCPSITTVQAPHRPMPQPNFVPVRPSVSRRTQSNGMAGTASTVCDLPFNVNLTAATKSLLACYIEFEMRLDGFARHYLDANYSSNVQAIGDGVATV